MISFFVSGIPKPAGSKRGFALKKGGVFTGRVVITDDCKTSRDWKTDVKFAAKSAYSLPLLSGPLSVKFMFYLQRPKGHFGSGRNSATLRDGAPIYPIVKPDVLKLSRAVEDACTGIIWVDDAQIVVEYLIKIYIQEKPGVYVEVTELNPATRAV